MFDNIVANNNINFNDLEKKIYKFVCNLGCCILKTLLENYDNKIKENRDKKIFRHKGYKVNSIKTVLGIVTYKRAIYEYTENENTKRECKKYIFLLDELVNITAIGKISANLVEKILSTAVETNSYRDASSQLMEKINIAKQCFDVALSIVLSLFAGMLLVYKNRISIVISMIRFVNKILFLLIVLEILVSDDISGMKMWGMGFLLLVSMLAASLS